MHYHLKATHGVEIELSPGLEERYLRMKTRAQMNLLQRGGHLTGLSHLYGSENTNFRRDNIDYDDTEDDCKSNDSSMYQHSGIGSDATPMSSSAIKSQGLHGHTGNDDKLALDLSISGKEKGIEKDLQVKVGEVITYGDEAVKKGKLRVSNETVLVTKVDGTGLITGERTAVYRCYICSNVFSNLSKMQCHLSLHFEKHIITYQCCFCDETFHLKVPMQEHLRRQHTGEIAGSNGHENGTKDASLINIGQETFLCKFCQKGFATAISLNKHSRRHLKNKSCYCHSCGKTFNFYTSLQQHIVRAHSKVSEKSKHSSSWVRSKLNFFISPLRRKPKNLIVMASNYHMEEDEPLNLANGQITDNRPFTSDDITMVIPRSPPPDSGDLSDHGMSQHSSDNNWSETMSETPQDIEDAANEIRSAPKKSLLPKTESSPKGAHHHNSWKNRHIHPSFHPSLTSVTSNNSDLPLNFSKSDASQHDSNNNDDSSSSVSNDRQSPDLILPTSLMNHEGLPPGYNFNAANQILMAKALLTHQTLSQYLTSTSQPMIFPPNHLPPSLAAMTQMMSLPGGNQMLGEPHTGTSKSPSPASHSSSKSEASPEDRDSGKDGAAAMSNWGPEKLGSLWNFSMYSPDGHTDGRKVTSLSRTHSR